MFMVRSLNRIFLPSLTLALENDCNNKEEGSFKASHIHFKKNSSIEKAIQQIAASSCLTS